LFLLDTNVISEFRRAKPHGAVLAWLARIPNAALFVPAIALAEIQSGIELTRDRDPAKAREIEHWLDGIAATMQVIPADAEVMRSWARMMHRKPREHFEDALIAATAKVRGLTVATRNTKHFKPFGVPAVDPFAPARN
jgi:toxin FitB